MRRLPKVLHVEDDMDIREIAQVALEIVGGLELHQCSSGQDAIEQASGFAPDLFLLDVMMPGMGGEDTLRGLRALEEFSATPTIFMTARAQETEVAKLMELGALAVITKPFDPMTLADQIIAIWEGANQS